MAFMRSGVRSPSAPPSNSFLSIRQTPRWTTVAAGVLLFLATAIVIVWQNSRLAVLWDLSYVLENAYRISLGDIPYRDFPFPYPPLTFLIQAAIIKLTGRVVWHHVLYCAVMGGLATILTWRILFNLLSETFVNARALAFILSFPLIVLGIYCVFPHPFYDPDCTLAILLALLLLQRAERKPGSWPRPIVAGIALVIPLFIKQNTGLAFFASTVLGLALLLIIEIIRGRSVRRYVLMLAGAVIALALVLLLIQLSAGLNNYWHWTIQFAAERRTPARTDMLEIYESKILLLWLSVFAVGLFAAWISRKRSQWLIALSCLIISVPFLWPVIYLLRDQDTSERAERLLLLWPLMLIVSLVMAIVTIKKRKGFSIILPFVLIATINGAFMSQQLWGSTYAIWPLFLILVADVLWSICRLFSNAAFSDDPTGTPSKQSVNRRWWLLPTTTAIVASLTISGGFYVWAHERLDYASLDEGTLTHATLPPLKGLSARGDWLPNFEELVRYSEREIPREEGILLIPGEDLFYYTTGRRPSFPVLSFDHTVNPYSPQEILKLARERNIRWLIVKQDLQDEDEELEKQRDDLTEALKQEFEQVESLNNYDVYRRNNSVDNDDK